MNLTNEFTQVGDCYGNFKITKSKDIKELQCLLRELEHEPSGATIVHIANNDPENVFCLSLRTLPDSSNGVAHILEHTVLCGSQKFPVRDPFFSMNRRSLNTYMNALTGPDFTCYPAASQVPKDFYNLLEVYLDAVFHPELKELSFLQEGHRLEFLNPQDSKSPLIFKGIVFNEMKGAMSSPIYRLWENMMQELFPDILYRHNSGGNPLCIPSLTYQGLLDFHKQYYQESRCTFYFYGNLPLKDHLDFLETHTLKKAAKLPKLSPNPIQKALKGPTVKVQGYPIASHEPIDQKTYIGLAWLTCPLSEQIDILALQVLDLILMGTDASPLKIALLGSKLCLNVQSELEDELSQAPFYLIFEGCEKENLQPLTDLTFKTLETLSQTPFDQEMIEGALHQLEFSRTEINSDYGPFGLSLILKMMPLKNVGSAPENCLQIHALFDQLRKKMKDPMYLPSLIQKYLITNTHFTSTVLFPKPTLMQEEAKEEEEMLLKLRSKLDHQEEQKIIQKTVELKEFQERQEHQDLEVLPKMTLNDVAKSPRIIDIVIQKNENVTTFFHPTFTNGVVYQDVVFKLPEIDFEDLSYIRLFTYLLPQLGSRGKSYQDNLKLIQNHTGGVAAFLDVYVSSKDTSTYTPALHIQGKSLVNNYSHLVDLMIDMIEAPLFDDPKRIEELLTQLFVELDHDLKQNSLRYALNLSSSHFYSHSYLSYYWSGLGYYKNIQKIVQDCKHEIPKLIDKLKALQQKLLNANTYETITTCDEETFANLQDPFKKLCSLKPHPIKPWKDHFIPKLISSCGKISSSPVFFTSMALKTSSFNDPRSAYLSIASKLLDNTYLHRAIREQGGAYGGGASNKISSGKFYFYAYRDPNLASTLQAFKKASEKVVAGDFSQQELEEAKLGILQKLDSPISPEYRGVTAYTWRREGKDFASRSALRTRIIEATKQDIQNALQQLVLDQLEQATTITFGPKEKLENENKLLLQENQKALDIQSI